ncbi:DinB family protein [Streptomyces genisteinicus]|uniref:DinB family protein n=1 Tax=Streptomyces genisteinicus TaxID=2768068 RepID=A0A7H0HM85_9ACTN|nr:DinB family protein [Streptomyces genisteinicus]QNP61651.1 DinB family protein [Streptomyces genisteinicus]
MITYPSAEPAVLGAPLRAQFDVFLDEYRAALHDSLDGLTEEQARRSLVASRTTLLGLLKHAVFVEKVWFDEAVTCRPREEIGIPGTPDESFALDDGDTVASVQRAHRRACEASRAAAAALGLDDLLHGNRRGPIPLRWVYLHILRELAQHSGHADILREQILDAADASAGTRLTPGAPAGGTGGRGGR